MPFSEVLHIKDVINIELPPNICTENHNLMKWLETTFIIPQIITCHMSCLFEYKKKKKCELILSVLILVLLIVLHFPLNEGKWTRPWNFIPSQTIVIQPGCIFNANLIYFSCWFYNVLLVLVCFKDSLCVGSLDSDCFCCFAETEN